MKIIIDVRSPLYVEIHQMPFFKQREGRKFRSKHSLLFNQEELFPLAGVRLCVRHNLRVKKPACNLPQLKFNYGRSFITNLACFSYRGADENLEIFSSCTGLRYRQLVTRPDNWAWLGAFILCRPSKCLVEEKVCWVHAPSSSSSSPSQYFFFSNRCQSLIRQARKENSTISKKTPSLQEESLKPTGGEEQHESCCAGSCSKPPAGTPVTPGKLIFHPLKTMTLLKVRGAAGCKLKTLRASGDLSDPHRSKRSFFPVCFLPSLTPAATFAASAARLVVVVGVKAASALCLDAASSTLRTTGKVMRYPALFTASSPACSSIDEIWIWSRPVICATSFKVSLSPAIGRSLMVSPLNSLGIVVLVIVFVVFSRSRKSLMSDGRIYQAFLFCPYIFYLERPQVNTSVFMWHPIC